MKSPGTGAMIISIYFPIFEDQQCIGYVGAGVFADTLMDSLLELDIQGLPNSEYVFINAESGVSQPGTYTYQDEHNREQFVVCQYLADRNWIFMVWDNTEEVYYAVADIRLKAGLFCAAVTALIILCLIVMMRRVGRNLVIVDSSIEQLGQLELEADQVSQNAASLLCKAS